ncbi:molybdenum cofactor guanylyltransferase [Alteromonas oceanisediminis]|uniref:molybdenum cofactor guanylyltransferase n=1 Tax=Alteromonas oceanisediminis TaxID=2836180 RepID=UPI001BD96C39|nr:molybdenum cofactor guanylyltransferase [Alteromonas oceanisediminis]MBT0586021.1 molybdenum cofactor guanylyltransferase [Alteromonas oceanisediminis]
MNWGVVLAGGRSERMQQDKAALMWQGRSLLDTQCNLMKTLVHQGLIDQYVTSGRQPGALHDHFADKGPVGGILSVIQQLSLTTGDTLLVCAVDMPRLTGETLSPLMTISSQRQASCYYHDSYLPVCLRICDALLSQVYSQTSKTPSRSVKSLLKLANGVGIPCERPEQLVNVNTPQQWQALLCGSNSTAEAH